MHEAKWHERGYIPHYEAGGIYQSLTYRLADSLPQEVLREAGRADCQSASSPDKTTSSHDKTASCMQERYSRGDTADCQSALPALLAMKKRKLIEKYLDNGYGSCLLGNPTCAQMIVDNWKFFDGERYDLIAYVVMPNHVHLLIKTYENWSLGKLVKTWKSFTAKAIRGLYEGKGDGLLSNADCQSARPGKNADTQSALPGADCQSARPGLPAILRSGEPFWQREYWDRFIRNEKHFFLWWSTSITTR